ncbi:hypothetical protein SEA_FORZA_19 [Gordonia phage Forza]|uniref:Uncharacterized protein n=1 Tax=Gordonia phage Forza TaxID=2571247 RepID=A0A650FAV6_9CAUD|nr:hypothetical protein PP303_gp019 [Gordonia phage Forza]QEM41488.1 hypothetical protein SEA_BOOPY_19 [Gordonia phage Boopy]QGT55012.1 hypothetical protein SEA_FORZA_19 [Gordonia phage Forza]UXE04161.1 hypothetical protein SEA_BLUENGOLD_17 [Gordonia phage BlueNGold]WBF03800.1 hypothetical protein SEA_MAREELIH_17 [Gordonia phage Mareelih]
MTIKNRLLTFWRTHEFNPADWVRQQRAKVDPWCNDLHYVPGVGTRFCGRVKFHPGKHKRYSITWENVGRK